MDLSLLSPQTLAAKAGVIAIYTVVVASGGFYGGCQFKQNQWDAEKFKQVEKTKNLERKDALDGAKKSGEFRQNTEQEAKGKDFVRGGIGRKPLVRVNCPAAPEPIQTTEPDKIEDQTVIVKEGTKQNANSSVYLTAHFMQLYDVSVKPGDAELRARTYDEAQGTSLDEGFEKVIVVNNEEYAAVRLQLNTLLDRIEQKKKLFKPDSEGVF